MNATAPVVEKLHSNHVSVECPFCNGRHEHRLRRGRAAPSGPLVYSRIRQIAPCSPLGEPRVYDIEV